MAIIFFSLLFSPSSLSWWSSCSNWTQILPFAKETGSKQWHPFLVWMISELFPANTFFSEWIYSSGPLNWNTGWTKLTAQRMQRTVSCSEWEGDQNCDCWWKEPTSRMVCPPLNPLSLPLIPLCFGEDNPILNASFLSISVSQKGRKGRWKNEPNENN